LEGYPAISLTVTNIVYFLDPCDFAIITAISGLPAVTPFYKYDNSVMEYSVKTGFLVNPSFCIMKYTCRKEKTTDPLECSG